MQSGDKIISIDGKQLSRINEAPAQLITAKEIVVEREGQKQTINLPVDFVEQFMESGTGVLVAPRIPLIVSAVPDDSHNKNVLKPGDFITQLNGVDIEFADKLKPQLDQLSGEKVSAVIKREDEEIRSEERRVGKEWRSGWGANNEK